MRIIDLSLAKGAIFSEDRKYRYALWRVWNPSKSLLMTIGLNPSVASEIKDDPTITRLQVRAYKEGYGGFLMANLYAYVSTDPKALLSIPTDPKVLLNNGDAIGEFTDYYLKQMVMLSERQLCGWGSFKPVIYRASEVYKMLNNPYCLGINADGNPKHPLYISYDTPMVKYIKVEVKL
jgi:hypothetical protein